MSNIRRVLPIAILSVLVATIAMVACSNVGEDDPIAYDYDNMPISIFNPDWGVIPLPNNFLNPTFQATMPVSIPGVAPIDPPPEGMALPIVDEAAVATRLDLGYPAEEDSAVTKALVKGMNKLAGFVPGFVVRLPFSSELDMNSVIPFEAEVNDDGTLTGSNEAEANFYFLDITDPQKPIPIAPKKYYRAFNVEQSDSYPYFLTLRNTASVLLPDDYIQGHTYLVVMTGVTERGVKDVADRPVMPDSFFLVFASEEPYIAPDGSPRNNVLSELPLIQEAEGGRQITNYGLKIWEGIVGNKWARNEVVCAYNFTIADNPMPIFFDPARASLPNSNPLKPSPADSYQYDLNFKASFVKADAACDAQPSFKVSQTLDPEQLSGEVVRLFAKNGEDWDEVEAGLSLSDDGLTVTVSPNTALTPNTEYAVAATGELKGENGRRSVDQSYFGLSRVNGAELVKDGIWQSPHLDSRIDTLIFMMSSGKLQSLEEATPEHLQEAGDTLLLVLGLLEEFRKHYEAPLSYLVQEKDIATELEDVVVFWTFTTGACAE